MVAQRKPQTTLPLETYTSLEEALREVDEDLIVLEEDGSEELHALESLARRLIVRAWTGEGLSSQDEARLRELVRRCRVDLNNDGTPVVRTPHRAQLFEERATVYEGKCRLLLEDGLTEWVLRGRPRDIRACRWCGRLFRADRITAHFHSNSCRTSYYRAINLAADTDEYTPDLLGWFECDECCERNWISEASGIVRESTGLTIGGMKHPRKICKTCVAERHPEWAAYAPTGEAA